MLRSRAAIFGDGVVRARPKLGNAFARSRFVTFDSCVLVIGGVGGEGPGGTQRVAREMPSSPSVMALDTAAIG